MLVVTGPPSPESPSAAAPSAPRERSTAPSAKPRIKAPARTPPRLYAPTAPSVLRPREAAEPQTGVYYSGCREARAAGAAPIYRGQPGYRPEMDGDGDGIACESRF